MGKIADRVNEFWSPLDLARAIDTELEALRQEIRDLRKDCIKAIELHEVTEQTKLEALRQKIQDLKMDNIRGGSISSPEEPEPELERGDFVSYKDRSKKVWGIFHHQDGIKMWAYWQDLYGGIKTEVTFILKRKVTFEFRPEK